MKRKVSQIGPATLMVSLPSKWVKKHNIKKGDEIDISESEGKLIVGGEGEEIKKTTINLTKSSDSFYKRLFSNAYKKGYDEILVNFPDENLFSKVMWAIKNLFGYEIVNQTEKSCLIKSLANEKAEEFDNLVSKCFLLLKHSAEICYQDISEGNAKNLDDIIDLTENIQKFTDFCRRLINKKIYKNSDLAEYHYIILMRLILIANKYNYIYSYISKGKKFKISKDTLNFFSETNKLIDLFYEAYYKKDITKINNIDEKKRILMNKTCEFLKTKKGCENIVIYHLAEIIRLVYDNNSQLMGLLV